MKNKFFKPAKIGRESRDERHHLHGEGGEHLKCDVEIMERLLHFFQLSLEENAIHNGGLLEDSQIFFEHIWERLSLVVQFFAPAPIKVKYSDCVLLKNIPARRRKWKAREKF
jgi:hypothetical protein